MFLELSIQSSQVGAIDGLKHQATLLRKQIRKHSRKLNALKEEENSLVEKTRLQFQELQEFMSLFETIESSFATFVCEEANHGATNTNMEAEFYQFIADRPRYAFGVALVTDLIVDNLERMKDLANYICYTREARNVAIQKLTKLECDILKKKLEEQLAHLDK